MLKWFLEESVNQTPFDGHHATILMKSNELFSKNCHKLNLAFIFVCFFGGFAPAICLTGCSNSHILSQSVSAIENSIDSPSDTEVSVSADNGAIPALAKQIDPFPEALRFRDSFFGDYDLLFSHFAV